MKKAFKSLVIFAFCLAIIMSTVSISLAAPGSFTLKASVTPTSVTLKWTESKNADKYVVYRKQGTSWKNVKELSAETKSYTIKSLKTGEKYTYRVKAVENVLIGSSTKNSNELTVTPGVPKVTGLKGTQYNYNTVKLTWTKLSGVTGYQIYQYNSKTKKWSKVKTVSSKYNYAHIKSLTNGTTYKFRVRAYYKSSKTYYGTASSTASVKVSVPAATVKTTTSYNAIKLSWNKVQDATGYRIYKYDSAKKKWVTAVKSTTKTSYTFKDLTTGKSYSYRVRPYQTVSKKVYWGLYETTKATPTLAKPTGFKAQPSTLTTVSFQWGKVSGAQGYRVYRHNPDNGKWVAVVSSTKSTSFKDTKLEPQTQYSYKVKAIRKVSGKNVFSSASSAFKISTELRPQVTEVNLLARTETSLTLSWSDIGADAYEIYTPSGVGVKRTSETTVTIDGLNPGTTYKYKIKGYFNEEGKTVESHFSRDYTFATEEKSTTPTTPTKPSQPSTQPSTEPSTQPSTAPSTEPSTAPSTEPSTEPSTQPSTAPSTEPSTAPSTEPSTAPSTEPSTEPSTQPSTAPSTEPSTEPSTQPSTAPSTEPSTAPSTEPSTEPSTQPSTAPSTEPSTEPSTQPSTQPTTEPTTQPVAPSKVAGLAKTDATESSISVKWNAATNATNYMLSYSKKGASNWTHISITGTTYVISGLTAGTEYEIKITAANGSTIGVSSDVLVAATTAKAPEAAKALTATSVDANNIKLSWEALSGAATYELQYYSSVDGEWMIVPGANNLTERTFTDTPAKSGRQHCGYLYRVVGRNTLGDQIGVTKTATGTTKGLAVTQDKYQATLTWDAIANVKNYSLLTYVKNLGSVPFNGNSEFTGNSVSLYLSPEDIHSFTLIANYNDGSSKVIFSGLSIQMPELDTADNSDKGVNAKLLYLERAINRTKYVNDDINVKYNSVSDYEIYYLKSSIALIFGSEYNGSAEVQKFFDRFNDGSSDPLTAVYSEVVNEDIDFRYGSGKNSKGKVVYLKYILEPTTRSDNYYLASIYDAQKPANWKNGFSKVEVKENSDGSYEYNVVLKQESLSKSGESKYHNGLFESVGSIASGDEAEINSATVGATTIKAVVGPDGVLKSYEIESPFDSDTELKFLGIGNVNTKIRGKNKSTYVFTK